MAVGYLRTISLLRTCLKPGLRLPCIYGRQQPLTVFSTASVTSDMHQLVITMMIITPEELRLYARLALMLIIRGFRAATAGEKSASSLLFGLINVTCD